MKCDVCQTRIPAKAIRCPHCGYRVKRTNQAKLTEKQKVPVWPSLIILALIFIFMGIFVVPLYLP